ncbi:hypothetical protein BC831DRAFT_289832 [Entophlyctis helioformis]|nr:hypothetical protein BC831DRAFT_289832 [Entophlyctis helioformis]
MYTLLQGIHPLGCTVGGTHPVLLHKRSHVHVLQQTGRCPELRDKLQASRRVSAQTRDVWTHAWHSARHQTDSLAGMWSRIYARSRCSVATMMLYRSARLSYISRSLLLPTSRTSVSIGLPKRDEGRCPREWGKDSCFNMMHAVANGHDIVALANLRPPSAAGKDELDSYMFQTVGHDVLDLYTECMGLPLFRQDLVRSSVETGADYAHNEADEVEDLYQLLLRVKESVPGVEAVSSGAILSNYQRVRIENVCARLGLTSLAFMWQGQQAQLLQGMIENGIEAILIKVAAIGLKEIHLGRTLAQMSPILDRLNAQFGINVCGEGGEYETLTLDCPLFKKRIVIVESEKQVHSYNDMAPVAYFKVLQTRLEPKPADDGSWIRAMQERIRADSMALADDAVQAMVLAHKTCTQSAASTVLAVDTASSSIDPNANFEPTVHWSPPFFAISGVTAASLGQAPLPLRQPRFSKRKPRLWQSTSYRLWPSTACSLNT